jgi:hypothetical protein
MIEIVWEIFKWSMFLLGCVTAASAFALIAFIWMQDR